MESGWFGFRFIHVKEIPKDCGDQLHILHEFGLNFDSTCKFAMERQVHDSQ